VLRIALQLLMCFGVALALFAALTLICPCTHRP
jgi:hypothetical protein